MTRNVRARRRKVWMDYGGSGADQLALALLANVVGDEFAQWHYQDIKREVISEILSILVDRSRCEMRFGNSYPYRLRPSSA